MKATSSTNASTTRFITNKMCPYAQKAWIALEARGEPYNLEQVSLYGPNGKPNWFWELNPQGTVPILVENENSVMPDSELILTHISKQLSEQRGGISKEENANIEKWRALVKHKIAPIGKRAVLQGKRSDLMKLLSQEIDAEIVGPYLCGDKLTVADCAAFPFLWRLDQEFGKLSEKQHQCGNIRKWIDHCLQDKAIKCTVQSSWWWWW